MTTLRSGLRARWVKIAGRRGLDERAAQAAREAHALVHDVGAGRPEDLGRLGVVDDLDADLLEEGVGVGLDLLETLGGDDLHRGPARGSGRGDAPWPGTGGPPAAPRDHVVPDHPSSRRPPPSIRPSAPARRAPGVDHVMVPTHDVVRKGWRLGGVAARGPGARLAPVPAPSRAVPARAEPGARPRPDRPHSGRRRPRRVTWTSGARVEALDASRSSTQRTRVTRPPGGRSKRVCGQGGRADEAGVRPPGGRSERVCGQGTPLAGDHAAEPRVRPVDDRSGYTGRGRRAPGTTPPRTRSPGPSPCAAWTNPP